MLWLPRIRPLEAVAKPQALIADRISSRSSAATASTNAWAASLKDVSAVAEVSKDVSMGSELFSVLDSLAELSGVATDTAVSTGTTSLVEDSA